MTVTRGASHVFLGMDMRFSKACTVKIKMTEYIKEAITDFGENISRSVATPANKDLFEIDKPSGDLTMKNKETFQSVIAKHLYVSKRARRDIELPIAFLCTRVACSTEQDWLNLKRVLEYLYGTLEKILMLGADKIQKMKTWVDTSYAVHKDMKSHTGGVVSFGRGAALSKSSKHKLNVKSSTEAELVGASDYLPYPIWLKKFLEYQEYSIEENIFTRTIKAPCGSRRTGESHAAPIPGT